MSEASCGSVEILRFAQDDNRKRGCTRYKGGLTERVGLTEKREQAPALQEGLLVDGG